MSNTVPKLITTVTGVTRTYYVNPDKGAGTNATVPKDALTPSVTGPGSIKSLSEIRGTDDGKAAAQWKFDGNTSQETYRRCIDLDEEGDPQWYDEFGGPSPLSGEWAGDLTLGELASDLGVDDESDDAAEVAEKYTDAFEQAYHEEVMRLAHEGLDSEEDALAGPFLTSLSDPRDISIDGSDVGGSAQFTDPASARIVYRTGDDAEPYLVVTPYAYGTALDADGNELSADSYDAGDPKGEAAAWRVTIQVDETYCTDYTDPGSTDVGGDTTYSTGGEYGYRPSEQHLKDELNSYLDNRLGYKSDMSWEDAGNDAQDMNADTSLVEHGYWSLGDSSDGTWNLSLVEQDEALDVISTSAHGTFANEDEAKREAERLEKVERPLDKPLGLDDLIARSDERGFVTAVIKLDHETLDGDIDYLNDQASLKVTGDEAALTDLSFDQIRSDDNGVWVRVTADASAHVNEGLAQL